MASFHPCLKAQVHAVNSARSQAMGGIRSVLTGDWSAFQNPAGLATVDRPAFAFHFENYFMVPGWGTGAFTGCLPVKPGTIGITYFIYGTGTYNEMRTGLVFGRSFGERFRAGIELDYLRIQQPSGYGNLHALVPGAGIQVMPMDNLILAVHVFNPAQQHFSNCRHMPIPVSIRAGAALMLGREVLICTELLKDQGNKMMHSMGLEYAIGEKLAVRTGILFSEFPQPTFGLGFQTNVLRFDISSRYHQITGYSFAMSLSISSRTGLSTGSTSPPDQNVSLLPANP